MRSVHAVFNLPVERVARGKEKNRLYVPRNNTFRPRGWIGETECRVFAREIAKREEASLSEQIEVKCTISCAPKKMQRCA